MLKYKWSSVGFNADATLVGQEIESIEKAGSLKRDDLIDYARRNKDSELYKCFEWDDEIAGEKYRQYQANTVLCSLKVVVKEDEDSNNQEITRAYVVVKDETNTASFKNISAVMENDDEYSQLKKRAYQSFLATKERYDKLLELEDLKDVVFDLYRSI